jgi:hypothetical protein
VLRELDQPSAAALAQAVRVHAPFHALGPYRKLEVAQRGDGAWTMRFQLMPHGILRLYVGETHLGPCKAFPALPDYERAVEPVGGRSVARHGQPASYRVFDAWSEPASEFYVRIEGEPDGDGVIAVATRMVRVTVPAAGHVVEQVLEPEQVQVILGQVNVGDGPRPPSLGGHAVVQELPEDGEPVDLAQVRVAPDGRFIARRTGKGRYRLFFDLDFFPGSTDVTVVGGASFELTPSKPALWATVAHPNLDLSKRVLDLKIQPAGPTPTHYGVVRGGNGESHVSLPDAGTWRVQIDVRGTNALPPQHVRFTAAATSGAAETTGTRVQTLPHGTLVVSVGEADFGKARGATVYLDSYAGEPGRSATLIPGLSERVTFRHVTAGQHDIRIAWEEDGRDESSDFVEVKAGETVTWKPAEAGP